MLVGEAKAAVGEAKAAEQPETHDIDILGLQTFKIQ